MFSTLFCCKIDSHNTACCVELGPSSSNTGLCRTVLQESLSPLLQEKHLGSDTTKWQDWCSFVPQMDVAEKQANQLCSDLQRATKRVDGLGRVLPLYGLLVFSSYSSNTSTVV